VPFVSLADLNLAINYAKPSRIVSPFCRFLESGGGSDFVTSITGEDSEMMRSMAFVTDSYFPRSPSAEKEDDDNYSLCDEENQPFDAAALRATANTIMTPYMYNSKGATRLRESVCGVSKLALWDYLDEDSVPVSLALPTVERTPMVCAVQTVLGSAANFQVNCTPTMNFTPNIPTPTAPGQTRTVQHIYKYKVDGTQLAGAFMGGKVKALLAFPFLRDDDANGNFEIDGRLSFFLSSPSLAFRTGGNDVLHLGKYPSISSPGVSADGVINIPFTKQSWRPSGIKKEDDALREFDFDLNTAAGPIAAWFAANDVATIEYSWQQTAVANPATGALQWDPPLPTGPLAPAAMLAAPYNATVVSAVCGLPPLDSNGVPDARYTSPASFQAIFTGTAPNPVSFQACVWIRVKNSNGKVVDLVPACMKDDDDLNGFNSFSTPVAIFLKAVTGDPYPLMKFTGTSIDYSGNGISTLAMSGSPTPIGIASSSVMVADPRYNYAPEHWFVMPGSFSKQGWLDNCQRGAGGRDGDIFMATSDMGYMQSIYELAFLPRLSDLTGPGASTYYGNMKQLNGQTEFAANFSGTANNHLAWQTYRPFRIASVDRDDFEGVGFNSEGKGFRVNPYSESTPIIMAALANTPYNWMVASTNETAPNALDKGEREVGNFVKNYCFNQMGPAESRFDWADLELVADQIRNATRGALEGNWQAAFDNLDWAGDNSDLAGAEFKGNTVDLYDVDRKFLYGYWKDSFAVKQQLFLIFVRAEPMMMGGGAVGQTPPQLGARAVALVWRDPTIASDGDQNAPHRTRVLFYRQFD
jgi:hypothetical protein